MCRDPAKFVLLSVQLPKATLPPSVLTLLLARMQVEHASAVAANSVVQCVLQYLYVENMACLHLPQ